MDCVFLLCLQALAFRLAKERSSLCTPFLLKTKTVGHYDLGSIHWHVRGLTWVDLGWGIGLPIASKGIANFHFFKIRLRILKVIKIPIHHNNNLCTCFRIIQPDLVNDFMDKIIHATTSIRGFYWLSNLRQQVIVRNNDLLHHLIFFTQMTALDHFSPRSQDFQHFCSFCWLEYFTV